jgi:DNA modification methylase
MESTANLFNTNVRIMNLNPMDKDASWPHSIEVCVCRVPIRKRDGFSVKQIQDFATKLKAHMVPNGIVFLICYAPTEDKSRPFEIGKAMSDVGFTYIDNIIVEKSWFPGKRSEVNLVNSHEFVLHFCNGGVWKLDRLPVKEYLKMNDGLSCPGNTWKVETGSLDDSYPVDLAELLIRMTDCLPGSVVFDPFMGSSAALRAALKLGHSFYGFEQDQRKIKKYKKIIESFSINNRK